MRAKSCRGRRRSGSTDRRAKELGAEVAHGGVGRAAGGGGDAVRGDRGLQSGEGGGAHR